MRKLGVVEGFAIRSFLVMAVFAVSLGWFLADRIDAIYLDGSVKTAEQIALAAIASQIDQSDLSGPLTTQQRFALDVRLHEDMRAAGLSALKVWDTEGRLLYSTDSRDAVGTSFAQDEDISGALNGRTVAQVLKGDDDEAANQLESGSVIEVYAPVRGKSGNEVRGIVEIYQPYAPVLTQIRETNLMIWLLIAGGMLLAYVFQISYVRHTAERLKQTEDQVHSVNERLQSSLQDLEEHSLGTLQALVAAVDAKDSYTASHSLSVTDYAIAIARRMRLSEEDIADLERASLLHDIGKIGVPENVLLKPSKLTAEEFQTVIAHSEAGAQIIESIPFLRDIVPIVRHHHERWDGTGYPAGLAGELTPKLARILAVADAFDAMTSDRPYRPGMRVAAARQELLRCRGIQFDPAAVDALFDAIDTGEVVVALWHDGHLGEAMESASA